VYRVITYPDAGEQVAALVAEALPFCAEAFAVLELAPWNGRPYNDDKPDGPMRELVFGANGEGTITYLILEDQWRVDVLLVQWVD
jgi:hypothetical protein